MFDYIYNIDGNLDWDNSTFVLYLCLVIFSLVLGRCMQKSKILVLSVNNRVYRPSRRINYFWFVAYFSVLTFLSINRDIGTDLPVYRDIFYWSNTDYVDSFENEFGFVLINRVIRLFTSDVNVAISIFSFVSMLFVYKTIEKYADNILMDIAMLSFVSMFYFQSYSLIRIYLVAYFLCFMYKYMIDGKVLKYALITLLCVFIHYSSILMICPILFYYIYSKNKILFYIGVILFVCFSMVSLEYLSLFNIFERYSAYTEQTMNDGGIGVAQFLFHLPLFVLYAYMKKKKYLSSCLDLLLVYSTFSFIYGCLGYKILMIGRVSVYFMVIYIILIPYLLKQLKDNHDKYFFYFKISFIFFFILRCHLYFEEYLFMDSIMPYKMIN